MLVALLFACTVTWVTTISAVIARGSDVITFIYCVSIANRVITLTCVVAVWIASVWIPTMTACRRWGLRCAALLALALATHLVVFNEREGTVEEWWLLVPFEHARGNVAEGLSLDWVRRLAIWHHSYASPIWRAQRRLHRFLAVAREHRAKPRAPSALRSHR
ncbi:MAG TPA: hypothetical protein VMF89_28950 [Polyangiales bacterium]|nr:hypothetical protein [Polyangiales bacterium]